MSRRCLVGVLGLVLSLAAAPLARADGRPPDASGTVCTYRVPEAAPYDTPQGHVRVHYVADPADRDSPASASTRVGGVPDWVVAAGEAAEAAWARETALGFPPPPADDGDGAERGGDARYDVYVCDLASHDLGELAATVADPPGSGFSYIVVDNDYAAREVAPLTTTGVAQLRVTIAHELFHAIQIGEGRGRLPEWLAEATAVWMEGIVAPPDVDREIYRVALGGDGTEEPYWQGGDLHEYGVWWLVQQLEGSHPGFVRRLLASAAKGDDDPRGLGLLASALGGRAALEAGFARFARTALDDPLVGEALHARRTARLRVGSRLVLRASVQPLSLRLWRVPLSAAAVTLRRSGARRLGVVVRRGSAEHSLAGGALRIESGQGSLLVLVIGGGGGAQNVQLTLSGTT
ncbi:MAG TPA: hypothetical protein VFD90_00565 [Gaiellales bacterium]|nr:hypothetical protein [Gaiellales bacterium]